MVSLMAEKTTMVVNLKDGTKVEYAIADVDSVSFVDNTPVPDPGETSKVYKITAPAAADFTASGVYKVMADGKQVAEACYEYIRSWQDGSGNVVDARKVVIYPIGADGKADLSQGIGADGSKIVWDEQGDSIASYTPGVDAAVVLDLYINEDGEWADAADNAVETTTEAYVINDVRTAADTQTYSVVKIGTQYWMAENLKAVTFRDGTAITLYKSTQASQWSATTSGAYHVYTDDEEYCWPDFGAMYNGYAIVSDKGLAPEGWEVTTTAQWNALKKYLRTGQSKKVKTEEEWTTVGTNLTGLSIKPGGYYGGTATGDSMTGEPVYYWTSTDASDFLGASLGVVAVQNSVLTTGAHGYTFGHYVRCVRK